LHVEPVRQTNPKSRTHGGPGSRVGFDDRCQFRLDASKLRSRALERDEEQRNDRDQPAHG
jgi:hypothetical protein